MISVPFFIAVAALAVYIPMPTEDPDVIPMPLEGTNIPAPEWFFLFLLRPFLNFDEAMASFLGIYLPLILLIVLIVLPYAFKGRKKKRQDAEPSGGSYFGALSRPIGKLKQDKAGRLRWLRS